MLKCCVSTVLKHTWAVEQTNRTRVDTVSVGAERGDLLRFFIFTRKNKKIIFLSVGVVGGIYVYFSNT